MSDSTEEKVQIPARHETEINHILAEPEAKPWELVIDDDEDVESALEHIAQLETDKTTGKAAAFLARYEKYKYLHDQIVKRSSEQQELIGEKVDAYLRPKLKKKGKAQHAGAYGTYRITNKRSCIKSIHDSTFKLWRESMIDTNADQETGVRLENLVTYITVEKPNKGLIESYMQQSGEVPDGVEVQEIEGFSIKPDVGNLNE